MRKVGLVFRHTAFVVVRRGGGSASNQLTRHMATGACVRQRIDNFEETRREMPKAIGKLNGCHRTQCKMKNAQCSMLNAQCPHLPKAELKSLSPDTHRLQICTTQTHTGVYPWLTHFRPARDGIS